jgi:hypothetical protein
MSSGYLCHDSAWLSWMPWAALGLYVVVFGVGFIVRTFVAPGTPWRGGRSRPIVSLVGGTIVIGALLFARSRSKSFNTIDIADGKVVLGHFWPQKNVEIASADVNRISIVRGRHFRKGKRQGDHAWFNLLLSGNVYGSCESSDIEDIVAQGRAVASALGKPIDWKERCPDANNNAVVMSTEADVTSTTAMTVPAACSSAGK